MAPPTPQLTASKLKGRVEPWLIQAMTRLSRGEMSSFDSCLVDVGGPVRLDETLADCHVHFVARDGNGRLRTSHLAARLVDCVIDYCIPRSRQQAAIDHFQKTGSLERIVRLSAEAKELFTQLDKSGEAGEMLLFVLLERKLRIPQILCKMPLKTSAQMHFNGADGVHAKLLDDGRLALYWGESKLHKSVASAIDECLDGVASYLLDDGQGRTRRDILLVRDNIDLGDPAVTQAVLQYFLDETEEAAKIEFRAACLVGFSIEDYPNPYSDDGKIVSEEVRTEIERWYSRVKTRIGHHKIETFEIQVFCLPLPSVDEFRQAVRQTLIAR